MRLHGKPMDPASGYPWLGTVKLLKDSRVSTTKTGRKQWRGFGAFESTGKREGGNNVTVGMSTGLNFDLADKLIDWPKGTVLLVVGEMKYSDYWTQRNGVQSYELVVDFVHDQHDYHAAQNDALDEAAFGGTEDAYGNSYDPGF